MIRKSMLAVAVVSFASLLACGSASARPASSPHHEVAGGWEKLGAREVDGKADRDAIGVGREDGRFRAIQLQVDGSALEMFEIKVTFGDGQTFEPKTRLVFDKNTRSRVIDLPGDKRVIKKVEFRYGNLPGGGRARVELWGQSA
jgi:hypothetical protein